MKPKEPKKKELVRAGNALSARTQNPSGGFGGLELMDECTNLFLKRGERVFSRGRLIEILAGRFHLSKKDAKRLLNDLCNFGVFVKLPRKAPTYALCTPITPKNEVARAAGVHTATARRVLLELALEGKVLRTRKKCADLWALAKKGV